MKDTLVIYTANWADEIDLSGSRLFTRGEWETLVNMVQKHFGLGGTLVHSVGTNEWIQYKSFKEWLACYTVVSLGLSDSYVEAVNNLYSDYTYSSACEKQFYYPEDFNDEVYEAFE